VTYQEKIQKIHDDLKKTVDEMFSIGLISTGKRVMKEVDYIRSVYLTEENQ
jgi:hypothetical protein